MLNRLFPSAVLITEREHLDYGRVGFLRSSAYYLYGQSSQDDKIGYKITLVPEQRDIIICDSRKQPKKFREFRLAKSLMDYLKK